MSPVERILLAAAAAVSQIRGGPPVEVSIGRYPPDGLETPQAVAAWQRALMARGYTLPQFGADGAWGTETAAATRRWARDALGEPVSAVGLREWEAMFGPPSRLSASAAAGTASLGPVGEVRDAEHFDAVDELGDAVLELLRDDEAGSD